MRSSSGDPPSGIEQRDGVGAGLGKERGMTSRRMGVWFVALLVAPELMQAQERPTLGVADLVDMAQRQNRALLAERERAVEAQGLLRQAGMRPAPTIEVEEASARPFGVKGEQMFSAGYFHTFETFGKRDKRIAAASRAAEAVAADLADRLRLLAFDVKVQYARAVFEQRKVETLTRIATTDREYYRLTSARIDRGDAPPLEGQLLQTELGRIDAQLVGQQGRVERALLELRKVVGLPATEPLALAPASSFGTTSRSLGDLQAQAVANRPDLRALQRLSEQAEAEETLAEVEGRTDLTASARYARTTSGFDQLGYDVTGGLTPLRDSDHSLSVGLSFFVFAPNRTRGAVEAARARTAAARLRREHLESVVRLDVEAAFRRWASAERALAILSDSVVGPSERNLAVLRQAYTLGQLRMFDVLTEQRRLIETEMDYLDAQAEVAEAFAELEASVGGTLQ